MLHSQHSHLVNHQNIRNMFTVFLLNSTVVGSHQELTSVRIKTLHKYCWLSMKMSLLEGNLNDARTDLWLRTLWQHLTKIELLKKVVKNCESSFMFILQSPCVYYLSKNISFIAILNKDTALWFDLWPTHIHSAISLLKSNRIVTKGMSLER